MTHKENCCCATCEGAGPLPIKETRRVVMSVKSEVLTPEEFAEQLCEMSWGSLYAPVKLAAHDAALRRERDALAAKLAALVTAAEGVLYTAENGKRYLDCQKQSDGVLAAIAQAKGGS